MVLDLGNVSFLFSDALELLVSFDRRVRAVGGHLVLCNLRPVVQEIFTISRFHLVFACFDTVRDAIGKLDPPALSAYDRP